MRFPATLFTVSGVGVWSSMKEAWSRSTPDEQPHGLILSADIGGTNSRFKLISVPLSAPIIRNQKAPGQVLFEGKYLNAAYSSFEKVVDQFLSDAQTAAKVEEPIVPDTACLAVAGVVTENRCRLTNLDWHIDGHALEKKHKIGRLELINDFVAQGYGILTLGPHEVKALNNATPREGSPMACLGAGTGLGECFLTTGPNGGYDCYPSEGGHAEWAPRGRGSEETQLDLLKYLKIKFSEQNRISVERIVSGPGISNIYDFLAYKYPERTDRAFHRDFLKSREAALVVKHATPGSLCEQSLNIFASCYGAEAGVTALKFLPFGGLYLTGGVTGKTMDFLLKDQNFMDSFYDKGRVSPILKRVPLFVVLTDDMGERGSHLRAVKLLHDFNEKKLQVQNDADEQNQHLELVPPRHDRDRLSH